MITLDQIKENYIIPVLSTTPFNFIIFTDTGDWVKAGRKKNTVTEYINGLFELTYSELRKLSGEKVGVSITTRLTFLVPCGDNPSNDVITPVQDLRNALYNAFEANMILNITVDGEIYSGGVAPMLPMAASRAIRSQVGDSLEYSCMLTFSYLENALNSSEVKLSIDGENIVFTGVSFTRKPIISSDLYSNSANSEGKCYAENSAFNIDFEAPVFTQGNISSVLAKFLLGVTNVNTPHTVTITLGELAVRTLTMSFGESSLSASGVTNSTCKVSLVPYASSETVGG